jgi:hypothetical protein
LTKDYCIGSKRRVIASGQLELSKFNIVQRLRLLELLVWTIPNGLVNSSGCSTVELGVYSINTFIVSVKPVVEVDISNSESTKF